MTTQSPPLTTESFGVGRYFPPLPTGTGCHCDGQRVGVGVWDEATIGFRCRPWFTRQVPPDHGGRRYRPRASCCSVAWHL